MNRKLKHTLIILIIMLMTTGCSTGITLDKIEKLMFTAVTKVAIFQGFPPTKVFTLESNEINILRESIRNGTNLQDIKNETPPIGRESRYFNIDISRYGSSINLIYDLEMDTMFVSKIEIHYSEKEKIEKSFELIDKYFNGIYQFKPSPKFREFIKEKFEI